MDDILIECLLVRRYKVIKYFSFTDIFTRCKVWSTPRLDGDDRPAYRPIKCPIE